MYLLRHQGVDDLPELIRQAAGKHENPAAHIALSRISQPFRCHGCGSPNLLLALNLPAAGEQSVESDALVAVITRDADRQWLQVPPERRLRGMRRTPLL